ncbi:hypothetical protein PV05_01760 [Exophiala xenobiotica]|uniref:Uncharacterized protein n=1 Tax=Exophiala xenobiotica TaxID=348802 RepID=A0A0D2DH91_9EURO|nr:uncharacterized protein PV05_01760 [Exophiala xenobiotica]KIW61662.1 hypothetical protein PV05_01760 [Exophiala xenobiotica]
MAPVFEGLMPSRRRPSRSRSESGKPLHARWGDVAISAPHDGGWAQQYPDNDLNNPVYQAHGSPDSQKTLVNNSPDLNFEVAKMEKTAIEEIRQPTPPFIQKERTAITITIPLPWTRKKEHRRSSSGINAQALATQVEKVITVESRPALNNIQTNIDEVIVAEARPLAEPYRADSPIVQTASPVYDDVSTFFTRAAFPDKGYASSRLPPIQTSVPPTISQPTSAISILSPVAEKYDGLSESNNATPMDNTPVAGRTAIGLPTSADNNEVIDVGGLTFKLAEHVRDSPPSLPPSRITSPIDTSDVEIPRKSSRSTMRDTSRPASRGPGLGEVAYMRASSRGPPEQPRSASREASARRSESQEPDSRRAGSVEPTHRRALSRDPGRRTVSPARRRTLSREPVFRRALSREPDVRRIETPEPVSRRDTSRDRATHRADSPNPTTRRAQSRDPARRRAESPAPTSRRELSREPRTTPRARTPDPTTARPHSRGPSSRRGISPGPAGRRAVSREPFTRRRISGDFTRRAASLEPERRRASPRENFDFPWNGDKPAGKSPTDNTSTTDASTTDDITSADETTDIDTETDDMYFESRKGWNGHAGVGDEGQGFYAGVIQDYKLIARDVEAEQTQTSEPSGVKESLASLVTIKKEKEKYPEQRQGKYAGPDLVPSQEELWG